ncbi:DinB family protein [Flavihumibacter sp. UBA7668]|uniref:DinB family protein n=1 Tax=Flavihumibacter sp. UBA7668 TaxID=1946542 RepID=UPI0025BA733B|nr:DinB family protein [Flavihumibacter sp. UBA7668]
MSNTIFKAWKSSRKLYLTFFDKYSTEQLNYIAPGFSNNLIWNIGHIIVAQESLVYRGSGLPMSISEELINSYKPGTKPEQPVSQEEVNKLKELLVSQVAKTEADFQLGVFQTYIERETVTGFHLASIEDALEFNNFHEGLHLGYMMSIRKFVQ